MAIPGFSAHHSVYKSISSYASDYGSEFLASAVSPSANFGSIVPRPKAPMSFSHFNCPAGWTFCFPLGLGCWDLRSDPSHCGSCTNVCPAPAANGHRLVSVEPAAFGATLVSPTAKVTAYPRAIVAIVRCHALPVRPAAVMFAYRPEIGVSKCIKTAHIGAPPADTRPANSEIIVLRINIVTPDSGAPIMAEN